MAGTLTPEVVLSHKGLSSVLSAFALTALAACGGEGGPGISLNSESFSYDYTENGCKTGEQKFDSLEALCAGLKDDQLNHGCAPSIRAEKFKASGCLGSFDPTPEAKAEAIAPAPESSLSPQTSAPTVSPEKTTASEAFAAGAFEGQRAWVLKDARVEVVVRSLKSDNETRTVLTCSSDLPLRVTGNDPGISFQMGTLICDKGTETPAALKTMTVVGSQLNYQARHLPSEGEPNQFRLSLEFASIPRALNFAEQSAVNAGLNSRSLYFDFKAIRKSSAGTQTLYFFEADVRTAKEGATKNLRASFRATDSEKETAVTIRGALSEASSEASAQ